MRIMLTWRLMFGVIFVVIIGCGSDEDLFKEETPDPSTEIPVTQFEPITDITPILGTWRLKSVVYVFGDEKTRQDADTVAFYLTFKPDHTFEATHSIPIQMVTSAAILASKGLQHIFRHTKEILLTFQGEYKIGTDRLKLRLLSASVTPKEAPEIDSDFENPVFYPLVGYVGDTNEWNYMIADDGSALVFWAEEGGSSAEINYYRPKTD